MTKYSMRRTGYEKIRSDVQFCSLLRKICLTLVYDTKGNDDLSFKLNINLKQSFNNQLFRKF